MDCEPLYLRFENTIPPHCKFYEVEIELSLFYPKALVRRWGRIGTRKPRSLQLEVSNQEDLQRQIQLITRQRQRHGYQIVSEMTMPP